MKRIYKRYFALFMALAVCVLLVPTAFAYEVASGTCGDNLTWTLGETGTLIISGTGKMEEYSQKAAAPWEAYKILIKTVEIKSGVTGISSFAFSECGSLVSAVIPDGVESIGAFAFFNCDSLTEVTMGTGIKSIGDAAFFSCGALTGMAFPAGMESIGSAAFSDCAALASVTMPESMANIGVDVFFGCTALKDIYYSGTQEQWGLVKIDEHNDSLKNAALHFAG